MSHKKLDRREFLQGMAGLSLATAIPAVGRSPYATAQPPAVKSSVQVARGTRCVVATVHPLASQAAMAAFERGGNAVDAAIAASLMLSVVDGHNSGIGGGCLALVRGTDGVIHAIDGRETAPHLASPDMFFRDGKPDPRLSQTGPLAAGVPGLLAALHQLAAGHGAIAWQAALEGAADVAENGFQLSNKYAGVLRSVADDLANFPDAARVLLDAQGKPWKKGDTLRQADLARSLRAIAADGIDWFYRGEFAHKTGEFMGKNGGLLRQQDFASYAAVMRQPIDIEYRDHRVIGFPPPSSGGIHVAQMLGMLGEFDLREIIRESRAAGVHLLLEVMKRAMADRAHWLGDADFARVPRGLLDPEYLRERGGSIDLKRATLVESHGQPPRADVDLFGQNRHTTHLTTADSDGNIVALTQTVNTSFGCKMIVPGTGVVLNNEMDDFSIAPGVRNAFGLVGSEANLIAPGKRPLSSMSPTIVVDQNNLPVMSCGAAGGPKIITSVLQILVRALDLGQSIDQAIASPRVHHQWSPDKAVCERAVDESVVAELAALGHDISRIASAAVAQGISFDAGGIMTAASDPRVPSAAMAV